MTVDEGDHLLGRWSSSAAKKAEAALRISLARRRSRTSRSRPLSRSCSSLASSGCEPQQSQPRRTHLRRVSADTPNLRAIEVMAAHCEVLILMLEHQPNGPLPQLLRIPAADTCPVLS